VGSLEDKVDLLPAIQKLVSMGFSFYATKYTHEFLQSRDISSALLYKLSENRTPNIQEYLEKRRVDLVINVPTHETSTERTDGYYIRRLASDNGISLLTNVQLAKRLVEALAQEDTHAIPLLPWPELLEHKG